MTEIHIGAAGWYYDDWVGTFYPRTLDKNQWLTYYAKYFDFTEINNTFYNLPTDEMVQHWYKAVPESFRFAVKVWQKITHEIKAEDLEDRIQGFFYRLKPLTPKISVYLLQFPPHFGYSEENAHRLRLLTKLLPPSNRYIIELRENDWFHPEILKEFIDKNTILLGTSYLEDLAPYYYSNQTQYYIRMIGDRELTEFKAMQREQPEMMEHLLDAVRNFKQSPSLTDIFVIFNNHFRGFSLRDINEFKRMLNFPFKDFTKQHSLEEFIKKQK